MRLPAGVALIGTCLMTLSRLISATFFWLWYMGSCYILLPEGHPRRAHTFRVGLVPNP